MTPERTSRVQAGFIAVSVVSGYCVGKIVAAEMSEYSTAVRLTAEIAAVVVTALVVFLVGRWLLPRPTA